VRFQVLLFASIPELPGKIREHCLQSAEIFYKEKRVLFLFPFFVLEGCFLFFDQHVCLSEDQPPCLPE